MIISVLVILVVPKIVGIEDYGYWQLYLFYATYVGFFHFGWIDGIYLRFGGENYSSLNKGLFFSQFWLLVLFQSCIAFFIIVFTYFLSHDEDRQFILLMISICTVLLGSRTMLIYIMQATNRIKNFARVIMLDRILYLMLLILFLVLGVRNYQILILADIIAKVISLIYSMYLCRDMVFINYRRFQFNFMEISENINVGIKLMFANITSILILGVIRLGIEKSWDIGTFGKVSLTLSISKFLMVFINSIGIVLYPILRRTDISILPKIYLSIRDLLMVVLLLVLVIYYPLKLTLQEWLPNYSDSFDYMALLFPMVVFEGKMSLLANTYLKTLRKEKMMLKINIIALLLSVIFTFFTTVIYKELHLAILSIVITLAFRSLLAEIYLARILKIRIFKEFLLEIVVTSIFMYLSWTFDSWFSTIVYCLTFLFYILLKKQSIHTSIKFLLPFTKNSRV